MKLSAKTLGCISFINILLFFVPAYSANLTVETNVYIEYSYPEYIINNKHIKMMKEIGARQWAAQNETVMKIDYIKDALNSIKRQNYDEAIDNCLKGLLYANYLNNSEKIIPKYYHYIGFAYLKNDDLVHSIANYNISINKYKNKEPEIFYERGLARYKIKDYEGAIEDFDKAVSLGLNLNNTLLNGEIFVNYKDEILNNKNLYKKYDKFNALNYYIMPEMNNYGKLVFLGKNYKKGEYYRAYDYYTKMINSKTPKLAEVYNNRGVYFLENYFYKKAIDDFKKAIELAPRQKETYFNLALVYYSIEDYEKAKKNLDNYFELCKNNQNNYVVGNYGNTKYEDNYNLTTFISQILKANIELKLENFNTANEIYNRYEINQFDEYSLGDKFPMEYLPLLVCKSYHYFLTKKYKNALKFLNNARTANYVHLSGTDFVRGKYFYFLENNTFDINKKYEVWENAYIFSNLALVECMKGNSINATEYIMKAKTIAFNYNKIDLYTKVVKTYNFLKSNFNIKEKDCNNKSYEVDEKNKKINSISL